MLSAIYEQDFLPCSFGGRPKLSAHHALATLNEVIEIRTTMEPYKWYPQRAGRVDLILERAQTTGRINDPVLRQEIAKVLAMSKAAEWTARRARAAQEQGRPQGPEGSLGKLASSIRHPPSPLKDQRQIHQEQHEMDSALNHVGSPVRR